MKAIESAINVSIMTQEGGAEYLYSLANDKEYTQKDKEECLKEILVHRSKNNNKVFEQVDWSSIINYHKETTYTGA